MTLRRSAPLFVAANVLMWLVMTAILVAVPDTLERWVSVEVSRVIGWAIASGVWVVLLQQPWRRRVGPIGLFGIQFVLWVSAAIVAMWISESARPFG
jgi:hypothetical protein